MIWLNWCWIGVIYNIGLFGVLLLVKELLLIICFKLFWSNLRMDKNCWFDMVLEFWFIKIMEWIKDVFKLLCKLCVKWICFCRWIFLSFNWCWVYKLEDRLLVIKFICCLSLLLNFCIFFIFLFKCVVRIIIIKKVIIGEVYGDKGWWLLICLLRSNEIL